MRTFGDSTELFRADVRAMLQGETAPEAGDSGTKGEVDTNHYIGTVQTRKDGKISVWSDVKKSGRLCYAQDGEWVEVLGAVITGTMAPATAKGYVGFVDTQYLVNRQYITPPEEGGEGEGKPAAPGEGIFIPADSIPTATLASFVEQLQ